MNLEELPTHRYLYQRVFVSHLKTLKIRLGAPKYILNVALVLFLLASNDVSHRYNLQLLRKICQPPDPQRLLLFQQIVSHYSHSNRQSSDLYSLLRFVLRSVSLETEQLIFWRQRPGCCCYSELVGQAVLPYSQVQEEPS